MKIGDSVYVHGYVDEIRKNTVIIRNDGGYFGTVESEVCGEVPKRKRGKWIRHNTYHGDDTSGFVDPDWRCSECGKQATVNEWMLYYLSDFCPNCGADMRDEDNE